MPFAQFRNREIQRKTCLRGFTGREMIKSCFFAAETLKERSQNYEAGKFTIVNGSFLTYFVAKYESIEPEPTKVKLFEKLGTNTNAVQTLTETGSPTGGTFTITYGGVTSGNIKYNATITEIAEALTAMSTIASGENIEVTSEESKPLNEKAAKVKFIGELGNRIQPLFVVNSTGLTGGTTPKVTPTTTTPGSTAEKIMGVYDGPDFDFWGNTAGEEGLNLDEPIPVYFHSCSFNIAQLPEYRKYGLLAEEALKNCTFF
jgi:hypothetical protein